MDVFYKEEQHQFIVFMYITDTRLLTYLQDEQILSPDQILIIHEELSLKTSSLDDILLNLCFITADQLLEYKSITTQLPYVDIKTLQPTYLHLLEKSQMLQHLAIPFHVDLSHIHVALYDPEDLKIIDTLTRTLCTYFDSKIEIIPYHAHKADILAFLQRNENHDQLSFNSDDTPLHMLEKIITHAIEVGASDIHFQPEETKIRCRLRIDGLMTTLCVLHTSKWPQMINKLKVQSQLDIAECRRPQSASFSKIHYPHPIEIRISTHPTAYGENVVLRLLDTHKKILSIASLGFEENVAEILRQLSQMPSGLIIVTGPTGSGKTTTLYALLQAMDSQLRNIMTLEAPIEAYLPHIRQTEIRETGVMTFAQGVRSLLRQDPDVILIGEIRDEETAQMAIRAVLTGHLVLSTMHTIDAIGVPARLMDLGVSPALLSHTLSAVISQRLVRQLSLENVQQDGPTYKGRFAIGEVFTFCHQAKELIAKGANRFEFENLQQQKRLSSLWDLGLQSVKQQRTTMEELIRVLGKPTFKIEGL